MQVPTLAYVEKKVAVLNKLYELAAEHHRDLAAILRPFIGCKIILADGRYIKEIRDKLAELHSAWEVRLPDARKIGWHNSLGDGRYSIFDHSRLDLVNAAYDGSRETVEVGSYLATMDGQILKELREWENRPVFDVGQTMADLERLARLKSEADELESQYRSVFRK
jgi:hypothetical protein